MKKSARKTPKQQAKNRATQLHSLIVRARGVCEKCGYVCTCDTFPLHNANCKLQCAHIISRRFSNTRTDESNAYALCQQDHMRFTEWPVEFAQFVDETIGAGKYTELFLKAQSTNKMDWPAELERLKVIAEGLGL